MSTQKTYKELLAENERLRLQLEEATETIHAIRTGQVDALVVNDQDGRHQLYTLKTADQTYRVFIEKMNEGAVTLNEEGIILYCNSMFASIAGVPLSKVIGLPFASFIPDGFREIYNDLFSSGWLEDNKTEISIKSGDRLVPCQLSVTTLDLDEGVSLSVIITDLTFQKETQTLLKLNNQRLEQANAELEKSNHDLQQFASVASHDLQEPLRKISIFSTMLRSRHGDELPADSAMYLNKIIASSNRMKTMIIDILSYSKLSTHTDHFALTDLTEIVKDVVDDCEIMIQEKNATVIIGDLPAAEVNRGQMRQVFQNLISNSIKFSKVDVPPVIHVTSQDASVTDHVSKNGNSQEAISIQFSDNGIGFNELYQDKIFSLFERLNTKDQYEGSGIGLAISKKIIGKHNGTISAISREGEGSCFIIRLPLHQNKS
ncbi:sensor histidine kinase [Dyadobacter bucti]|uniref:sensor histidine kinase n=1 Tax=Dyadobacter bucti TaxID=2572203 RepID=UPI001107B847|nr:ATP-binding protein [Dyadobacter bucti]